MFGVFGGVGCFYEMAAPDKGWSGSADPKEALGADSPAAAPPDVNVERANAISGGAAVAPKKRISLLSIRAFGPYCIADIRLTKLRLAMGSSVSSMG